MAVVDGVVYHEISGEHGKIVFRCALTGTSSTITSAIHKMSQLDVALLDVRGTNTMTYTVSGTTITVTGTNDDILDVVIYGKK